MNFWLLWWLDLIEIDMKIRPNWFRKTQISKFGWLLKLPKSLGNCPKSQRVLSGLKLTWKWVASAWTGWQVPVWDPNHTQQRQTTVWRALRPTGQILGQLEKWLKFAWKWTKMTWKWFKWLGLGPSLYFEGIRPMFEAFWCPKWAWKLTGIWKTSPFLALLRSKSGPKNAWNWSRGSF